MPVPGFRNRQANAAFRAQSRAVVATQRPQRKLQSDGVDDDRLQVDLVVHNENAHLVLPRVSEGDFTFSFGHISPDSPNSGKTR